MTYDTGLQPTLTALADPTRRKIFEALHSAPRSVSQLAGQQPVSRPAVSQHLKVLHEAGLVTANSKGTRRIYAVRREGLADLRAYLDTFWNGVLDAYAHEIETQIIDNQSGDDND